MLENDTSHFTPYLYLCLISVNLNRLIAPGTISMFKERGIGVEKVYQRVKAHKASLSYFTLHTIKE